MLHLVQFTKDDGTVISGTSNAKLYYKQSNNKLFVFIDKCLYVLSQTEKETFHCLKKSSPVQDKQSLK
jgi:hypothetical protein